MMRRLLANFMHQIREGLDRDPNKFGLRPDHDWKLMVLAALAVNAALIWWSFSLFADISRDDSPVRTAAPETLSKQKLDEALVYFRQKKNTELYLLTHPPKIADPSR